MLGLSALSSLETAGDNDRCLNRMAGPTVPGGAWQCGRPVDTWFAGGGWDYSTSAEKDRQGRLDPDIHLRTQTTALMDAESKRCAESGLTPASCWWPTALLKHTGPRGLKGDKLGIHRGRRPGGFSPVGDMLQIPLQEMGWRGAPVRELLSQHHEL